MVEKKPEEFICQATIITPTIVPRETVVSTGYIEGVYSSDGW